jgi:hypothetical protein
MHRDAPDHLRTIVNVEVVIRPMATASALVGADKGERGGIDHATTILK